MNLDVLVADFDRVIVTAFDLIVDVEFCSIAGSAKILPKRKLPEERLERKHEPHLAASLSFSLEP